jgi:AcrR family transcriptional regulator
MATPRTAPVRRRADAERSIAAILDAALACFHADPDASMTEIAQRAGVGRVTLYGHFPSREALLDALFDRTLTEANAALDEVDVERGPADEALARLIASSWRIVDRHRSLLTAALRHLGPEQVRERHGAALERVDRLVARGRSEGVFRADVPSEWLVTVFYTLMHAAAQEVDEGRLAAAGATRALTATLLGALGAPGTADSIGVSGVPGDPGSSGGTAVSDPEAAAGQSI